MNVAATSNRAVVSPWLQGGSQGAAPGEMPAALTPMDAVESARPSSHWRAFGIAAVLSVAALGMTACTPPSSNTPANSSSTSSPVSVRSDGNVGVDVGGTTINSNGTVGVHVGSGITINSNGTTGFDVGNGVTINSDGTVGFHF